jgi:hypothetical protein
VNCTDTDTVQSELTDTDTVQSELMDTDTVQSEFTDTDIVQSELTDTDTDQSELTDTDTVQSEFPPPHIPLGLRIIGLLPCTGMFGLPKSFTNNPLATSYSGLSQYRVIQRTDLTNRDLYYSFQFLRFRAQNALG